VLLENLLNPLLHRLLVAVKAVSAGKNGVFPAVPVVHLLHQHLLDSLDLLLSRQPVVVGGKAALHVG